MGVFLCESCPDGDFPGGSFPGSEFSRWEFSWVEIVQVGLILDGNFLWWKFSWWELCGGNHPGCNFPGGSFHVTLKNSDELVDVSCYHPPSDYRLFDQWLPLSVFQSASSAQEARNLCED